MKISRFEVEEWEREIRVANVPTYGDHTVAEHVFAPLLSISHHMVAVRRILDTTVENLLARGRVEPRNVVIGRD